MPETTPLLSSSNDYYFLKSGGEASSNDAGVIVEAKPDGAEEEEFAPKQLPPQRKVVVPPKEETPNGGFFSNLFAQKKQTKRSPYMLKQRKAPIKVEPKVFFANERTFLAWMHVSIILAGASIAILAFSGDSASPGSQMYGVVMLPVAVAFIVYAMYQYVRRAYMIRNKHPGPYDDTVGPTVLGVMLMLSIVAQFGIKLYSMSL